MTRIAIISSPRSGNSWLRILLSRLYGLEQFAVHTPQALDWGKLPRNAVLQLHWHCTPPFRAMLSEHDFKIVVLARHPLDVLLSILHFAPHEPETACWLDGEGGNEQAVYHMSPTSPAFLSYAEGPRAKALLSISREWWGVPGVIALRYEDLVHDTTGTLESIATGCGPMCASISEIVEDLALEKLKPTAKNQHFWKGQPGLWKTIFPAENALRIAKAHESSFSTFGYQCAPDLALTSEKAEENWARLCSF